MHSQILAPVVGPLACSPVMLLWMRMVGKPGLKKAGIDMSRSRSGRPGILDGMVEEREQRPAHLYIHLMEQPTIFYAVCFALALLGAGDGVNAWIAWAYVGLRVLHSLVQASFNKVAVRFSLFVLSTLALAALTLHAGLTILHQV
jgi:uncharacterized MAPEG superfamily protein